MKSPFLVLHDAEVARIEAETTYTVYDDVPEGAAYPYVVMGEMTGRDWSDKFEPGQEVYSTKHIWSQYKGKKEAVEIGDGILQALSKSSLDLSPIPVPISPCDVTIDWTGTSLSIDNADYKEGTGSLKDDVVAPVGGTFYNTILSGSWDWSAKKHILFWFKCDRASAAFTVRRFLLTDTLGNWRRWNLPVFAVGEWTAVEFLLSTGVVESGTPPDLTLVNKVYTNIEAADTTAFYIKIDDLRVREGPNFRAVLAELDTNEVIIDIDGITRHGILRQRYLIEEVPQ